MMLTTQIANKNTIIVFLLFVSLAVFAQEKEAIYIKYDKEREISDTLEQVDFLISPNFLFNYRIKASQKVEIPENLCKLTTGNLY